MTNSNYQLWFNVVVNDVEHVEMITAKDRAEATDIVNELLMAGIKCVRMRNVFGQWITHELKKEVQ